MIMAEETCIHCRAYQGLHHYDTMQCPKGGVEAPIGRKQEWQQTTFDNGLCCTQAKSQAYKEIGEALQKATLTGLNGEIVLWDKGFINCLLRGDKP